ncbi:MAG: aminotransferase class V-fold PLP-dependent enzyme [Thermoproteota archaeon]
MSGKNNLESTRKDFPLLSTGLNYLDNAATSLTPIQVLEAMNEYYTSFRANVGRGIYRTARMASDAYNLAHRNVAKFVDSENKLLIFTKNCTEALCTVINGLRWRKGDKAVISILEHHSNYASWIRASKIFGFKLEVVNVGADGIEIREFEEALDDRTRIVSFSHVSNVLGSIAPIEELYKIAHSHGAFVMVDMAQSIPHMPIDSVKDSYDFMSFSGHKMLGPTGIGALVMRRELADEVDPIFVGGGAVRDVILDGYELAEGWERFEAGTPNIAGAIGLARATEYLEEIGMQKVRSHEEELLKEMIEGLSTIEGINIYGPSDIEKRSGIVSFSVNGLNPHIVATLLDSEFNIAVRSGHMCCYPLMKYILGKPEGLIRASVYIYNTMKEVDHLISSLRKIIAKIG